MLIRLAVSTLLVALAPLSSALAQAPIVIKFSHVVAVDTPKGMAAEYFRKLVEERTKGKIKIEVHPNSQLYKDKEELEALQLGAVQMLAPSLSKFGPMGVKEFEIFDLPYIFPNDAAFEKITKGPIGRDLLKLLEKRGITGLAYWSGGFHVFSANRPIEKPVDLKGLKMRIPASKVLEASLRTIGALPQVMAFSEVYQALQTGVVDGTENILSSYTTQKYIEVQKHIALTYHTHTGYAVIVNKKFWDALPGDLQTTVGQAMKDATEYENRLVIQENQQALAKIRASGKVQVHDLSDAQRDEWRKAMWPVHKDMEGRVGAEFLHSIYQTLGTPTS